MMKRLIIILATGLFLLGLTLAVWRWLAPNQGTPPADSTGSTEPNQSFPVGEITPPVTGPAVTLTPTPTSSSAPTPNLKSPNSNYQLLHTKPVAGVIILHGATTTDEKLIFLERDSGLIYQLDLNNPKASPIVTDFKPIETLTAPANQASEKTAIAPARDQIFTLEQIGEDTIGKITDLKTKKQRLVFNSPFNQWLTSWPEKNTIMLETKPASQAPGYLYFLNVRTAGLKKIIGGVNGLMALVSPDGQKILYSRSPAPRGSNDLELGLYNRQKNENRTLAITTLPEKCVWTNDSSAIYCAVPKNLPAGLYPDDWLSGEIFFDDLLWQINAVSGAGRLIWADEPGLGDVVNLLVVKEGEKFIFTDRLTDRLHLINLVKEAAD